MQPVPCRGPPLPPAPGAAPRKVLEKGEGRRAQRGDKLTAHLSVQMLDKHAGMYKKVPRGAAPTRLPPPARRARGLTRDGRGRLTRDGRGRLTRDGRGRGSDATGSMRALGSILA
eukprot:gene9729-22857_t